MRAQVIYCIREHLDAGFKCHKNIEILNAIERRRKKKRSLYLRESKEQISMDDHVRNAKVTDHIKRNQTLIVCH